MFVVSKWLKHSANQLPIFLLGTQKQKKKNASQTLGNHNPEVSIYYTVLQHLPKRLLLKPSCPSHSQTNQHPPDVSIWPGSRLGESHSFIIALTQGRIRDIDSWSNVPKPNLSTQRLAITLKARNFPQELSETHSHLSVFTAWATEGICSGFWGPTSLLSHPSCI